MSETKKQFKALGSVTSGHQTYEIIGFSVMKYDVASATIKALGGDVIDVSLADQGSRDAISKARPGQMLLAAIPTSQAKDKILALKHAQPLRCSLKDGNGAFFLKMPEALALQQASSDVTHCLSMNLGSNISGDGDLYIVEGGKMIIRLGQHKMMASHPAITQQDGRSFVLFTNPSVLFGDPSSGRVLLQVHTPFLGVEAADFNKGNEGASPTLSMSVHPDMLKSIENAAGGKLYLACGEMEKGVFSVGVLKPVEQISLSNLRRPVDTDGNSIPGSSVSHLTISMDVRMGRGPSTDLSAGTGKVQIIPFCAAVDRDSLKPFAAAFKLGAESHGVPEVYAGPHIRLTQPRVSVPGGSPVGGQSVIKFTKGAVAKPVPPADRGRSPHALDLGAA